jgi:predicted dienelactone hydrolase
MRTSNIEYPESNFEWNFSLRCSIFCFILLSAGILKAADYDPDAKKLDVATLETTWHDVDRDRDVPVKIYYPKALDGKLPVIIFSHGLGGSCEGYSYVGQYWAQHGYVSVHLTHHGSDTEAVLGIKDKTFQQAAEQIAKTPMSAVDRCKDVSFAIDELKDVNDDEKSPLKSHLDLTRLGMAGHSFGANTTMLIAGETTRTGHSFADDRIKCAIAMSPPVAVSKAMYDRTYGSVKIPLFVMTGTLDDSPVGDTKAIDRRVPFDHVSGIPAYLITFNGGDHMVFSGRQLPGDRPKDAQFHKLIQQGSIAFWHAYLRDDNQARQWLSDGTYAKAIGDNAKLEMKKPE